MFLTAVIDWFSPYVLSLRLSNTLETRFYLRALDAVMEQGRPEIFNTNQGSQLTSREYTGNGQRCCEPGRSRSGAGKCVC